MRCGKLIRNRLRRVFLEDGCERGAKQIGVCFRKNQRRAKLDDVVIRTVGASEHAAVAKPVDDVVGFVGRRFTGRRVAHKIDAEEQA